jgi:hypothetical protein
VRLSTSGWGGRNLSGPHDVPATPCPQDYFADALDDDSANLASSLLSLAPSSPLTSSSYSLYQVCSSTLSLPRATYELSDLMQGNAAPSYHDNGSVPLSLTEHGAVKHMVDLLNTHEGTSHLIRVT